MWKMTAKVMVENPATGVGQGYYRGAYGDVQAEYFRTGERSETEINIAGCPEYGFNEYLQIGAETGVPGLVLFVFLVMVALWRLFKARSVYAFGFLALMAFAFFSYPFSLLSFKMLFVILLAVAGSQQTKRRKSTTIQKIVVGAALAGCIGAAAFATKPYLDRIEATREWQELRRWYSMEMYSYVLEDYPGLMPLMGENPAFMFEYGRSLNWRGGMPRASM
jgi:O-antigen ligase